MTRPAWLLALSLLAGVQAVDDAARADVQARRAAPLEAVMRAASDDGRPLLAAGVLAALLSGPAGRALVVESALVLVPLNLVVEGLKWGVDRHRPSGGHHRGNASFPSSHAANAFAIAWILARKWRRAAAAWFALAAVVGYSRLYLDRHWLSDVVAGALLGCACAAWLPLAWRNWRASRRDAAAAGGSKPPVSTAT